MPARSRSGHSVFLNVPLDRGYEPQFIALKAAIIAIGGTPRCVLEIAERGAGRPSRLLSLITGCDVSIHDLSRVGMPARFNGHDPYIHRGRIRGTIECVVNALRPKHGAPAAEDVYRLYRTMCVAAQALAPNGSVFSRSVFLDLVAVGVDRVKQTRLLNP